MSDKVSFTHEHDIYVAIDGNDNNSMWVIVVKRWYELGFDHKEHTMERELARVEINAPILDQMIDMFIDFRNNLKVLGL